MMEKQREAMSRGLAGVDKLLIGASAVDNSNPRLQKCLDRAETGEIGAVRTVDLIVLDEMSENVSPEQINQFVRLLKQNPNAQPGRPIVNIVGETDDELRFVCLNQPELVLAAKQIQKDILMVVLVREDEAAAKLMCSSLVKPFHQTSTASKLSPFEIARLQGFMELDIDQIIQSNNIRTSTEEHSSSMDLLVQSIRTIGLQNPPVIEVKGSEEEPTLECISGHRRLLALKTIGETKVTCSLRIFENCIHSKIAALAENVNRTDLCFLDRANAYGLLISAGATAAELVELFDSDIRTTNKYLRAANWEPSVKEKIRLHEGRLSVRFLINDLAAGERSTEELHKRIDKQLGIDKSKSNPLERNLMVQSYFSSKSLSPETQHAIIDFLRDMKIPGWKDVTAPTAIE